MDPASLEADRASAPAGSRSLRVLAWAVLAVVVGVSVAVASRPYVGEFVGRWTVDSAYRSLSIPQDWSLNAGPSVKVVEEGGVLLTAVYSVSDSAEPLTLRLIELAQRDGWTLIGGSPDLQSALLRRGDLTLGVASVGPGTKWIRVEIARLR